MDRSLALCITLLLVGLFLLPGAAAGEATYYAAGARALGVGAGVAACTGGCDLDGDGQQDLPRIGHVEITFSSHNLIVFFEDAVSPDVPVTLCFWNPDGDHVCDEDDVAVEEACATTVGVLRAPFAGTHATAYIGSLYVGPDLETCFATTGTATW